MSDDVCGSTDTASGEPCQFTPGNSCPWHNGDGQPDGIGRPSKVSKVGNEVISYIEDGLSLNKACKEAGTTLSTARRWVNQAKDGEGGDYKEFFEKLKSTEWWGERTKHHEGDSYVEVDCSLCDNRKLVAPYRAEKYDKHVCSEHNPAELQSVGEGRTRDYMGPNWETQRAKALQRDGYTCQNCGMDEKAHLNKYDQGLHVHHIIARRHFDDDDPKQNELSNLTTLCRDCHEVYEGCSISPVQRVQA